MKIKKLQSHVVKQNFLVWCGGLVDDIGEWVPRAYAIVTALNFASSYALCVSHFCTRKHGQTSISAVTFFNFIFYHHIFQFYLPFIYLLYFMLRGKINYNASLDNEYIILIYSFLFA